MGFLIMVKNSQSLPSSTKEFLPTSQAAGEGHEGKKGGTRSLKTTRAANNKKILKILNKKRQEILKEEAK